eukprot:2145740-Prymnesium_polylepis.1
MATRGEGQVTGHQGAGQRGRKGGGGVAGWEVQAGWGAQAGWVRHAAHPATDDEDKIEWLDKVPISGNQWRSVAISGAPSRRRRG